VAAIKLVRYYQEMEHALDRDDILLASTIRDSLFPSWLEQGQPDDATYFGNFPAGYWSESV